ncbi:hypothetical protein OE88DRAFT_33640 [Heliocybe sulcata]|uniref:Uncharacterized protein n=1 Tax=Heliocybe sulcata TaxID=5364 RepID=A0A5C3NKA3_9AGAM|nr:hypothetical protein OE88DRAFT_33640 [Heliocybe sulcata]
MSSLRSLAPLVLPSSRVLVWPALMAMASRVPQPPRSCWRLPPAGRTLSGSPLLVIPRSKGGPLLLKRSRSPLRLMARPLTAQPMEPPTARLTAFRMTPLPKSCLSRSQLLLVRFLLLTISPRRSASRPEASRPSLLFTIPPTSLLAFVFVLSALALMWFQQVPSYIFSCRILGILLLFALRLSAPHLDSGLLFSDLHHHHYISNPVHFRLVRSIRAFC